MKNYFLTTCCFLLLLSSSCSYRADRFDEHLITAQANHFNLYRNLPLEIVGSGDGRENIQNQALVAKMVQGEKLPLGENPGAFSVLPALFKQAPPLVHIYQELRGKKEKKRSFYVPFPWFNGIHGRFGRKRTETVFSDTSFVAVGHHRAHSAEKQL